MRHCVHCGEPASGEYPLVFERETELREIELALCDSCVGAFDREPNVSLAE